MPLDGPALHIVRICKAYANNAYFGSFTKLARRQPPLRINAVIALHTISICGNHADQMLNVRLSGKTLLSSWYTPVRVYRCI
jgi:hypothetical protein